MKRFFLKFLVPNVIQLFTNVETSEGSPGEAKKKYLSLRRMSQLFGKDTKEKEVKEKEAKDKDAKDKDLKEKAVSPPTPSKRLSAKQQPIGSVYVVAITQRSYHIIHG